MTKKTDKKKKTDESNAIRRKKKGKGERKESYLRNTISDNVVHGLFLFFFRGSSSVNMEGD